MRFDIILILFLSIPFSVIIYLILIGSIKAHLRNIKEKVKFFFWPYGPDKMLVIQELDGEYKLFYDDEYEEIQSENKTLIKTIFGDQYVTEVPPSQASVATSLFEARGPPNYYSPFSVGWRWVVAAAIMIYMLYAAVVMAVIPTIDVQEIMIGLVKLNVAIIKPIDPWEVMVTVTAFFIGLTWMLVNIQRMNDRTIMYSWYHSKGINPPHISIVPSPTVGSIGLLEYLGRLGREIIIVVPKELNEVLNHVKDKTGSKSLAAVILSKLAMAKTWRESLANTISEQFVVFKAGETSAAIRLNIPQIQRKMIPAMILIFLIGVGVGFGLGNLFGVGVEPVGPGPGPTAPAPPIGGNQTIPAVPGNQTSPGPGEEISPPNPPPPPEAPVGLISLWALDPRLGGLGGDAPYSIFEYMGVRL